MHLITFATKVFEDRAENLVKKAREYFDTATWLDKSALSAYFVQEHSDILSESRGAGLWLWKPYVIYKNLKHGVRANDILVYCDAGYEMLDNLAKYVRHFFDTNPDAWICVLRDHHFLPNMGAFEHQWTKAETFDVISVNNPDESMRRDPWQAWAGFVALKKCDDSIEFAREWLKYCSQVPIINNEYSKARQHPQFREHRHDQSILSVLCRKHNITPVCFPDGAKVMRRVEV